MPDAGGLRDAVEGAAGVAVLLSANPIHDTGGGQRSAQIALELLERGWAVVFVSHGEVTETVDLGLRYDHPRLLRWGMDEALDEGRLRPLIRSLSEVGGAVITQVPVAAWLPFVQAADAAGASTIYDCIDRWDSELGRGWYRAEAEAEIARASSGLVASAPVLVDRVEALTRRETRLVPNAYNARIFDGSRAGELDRPSAFPERRRIALYVGALWGGWMDWALIRRAARRHSGTSFVFVGDRRREGRGLPPNCVFTGLLPQTDLPAYLAHADVGFLPWKADEVTAATSPLKVFEFLAMGLPVVAPDIEPLRGIPGVRLAGDREELVELVGEVSRAGLSPSERDGMRDFARSASWHERVDDILDVAGEPAGAGRGRRRRPAVSVVVPAYNHERWVGEAVRSVAGQTLPAGEIVVVDDGSTDDTARVVRDSGVTGLRLIRQENRGAHRALNRAIRLARGDWIAILDSDDAFLPERLEHAWGVARETGAALVCGSVRLVDGSGGEVDPAHEIATWYAEARRWADEAGSLERALRRHNVAVTTSNFFLHRSLWERLEGFRDYRYVHDWDFLLRAMELCPDRIVFEPELEGVLYRVHGSNTIVERRARAAEERRGMIRELRRPVGRIRRYLGYLGSRGELAKRVDADSILEPIGRVGPQGAAGGGASAMNEGERRDGAGGARRNDAGDGRAENDAMDRRRARREARAERSGSPSGRPPPTVGLVVDSLGTGGLEEVVALLAQALPPAGLPAAVLCASGGGPVARRLRAAGVSVTELSGRFDDAPAWVEREGIVAVSSHFAPVDLVVSLARVGVPVVETVQNTYAWLSEEQWSEERRRADAVEGVIAVSETVAAYYRDHVGHDAGWVVPNGVHPARAARVPRGFARRALGLPADSPVFAFVGRVTEQKNPRGLLDAFATARDTRSDAVLVLAGPADRSAGLTDLRRRHRHLFRSGAVRHLSSPRHVGTILSAADAYVSDAFYEGWSVAASEALWAGRPVLLSEVGGSASLVGNRVRSTGAGAGQPGGRRPSAGEGPSRGEGGAMSTGRDASSAPDAVARAGASRGSRGYLVPNPCGDPLTVTPQTVRRPPASAVEENVRAMAHAMSTCADELEMWRERAEEIRAWARSRVAPGVVAARYAEILGSVVR